MKTLWTTIKLNKEKSLCDAVQLFTTLLASLLLQRGDYLALTHETITQYLNILGFTVNSGALKGSLSSFSD